jgi:hypothetical protein
MGNDRWRLVHALRQAARTQARKGGSKNGNAIHWLMNLLLPLHYLNLRKTAEEMGLPRIGMGQSDVLLEPSFSLDFWVGIIYQEHFSPATEHMNLAVGLKR